MLISSYLLVVVADRLPTADIPVHFQYPRDMFTTDSPFKPATISQRLKGMDEATYNSVSRAQDKEDVWAYENWFYGMENGTVLESGGLDGLEFSNSYFFENFAQWRAIHIEAHKVSFGKLRKNRPRAVNINCALCSTSKVVHYVHSKHATVGGIFEFMSPGFIQQWHPEVHAGNLTVKDFTPIQCLRIESILRILSVNIIDIWSLDVEGAELSVLQGMDFSKVTINGIIMECDGHNQDQDKAKRQLLEENGFQCEQVIRNCMCKNKLFTPSKKPPTSKMSPKT